MKFPEFLRIAVVPNATLVHLNKTHGYYEIVGGIEGELIKLCAQALKFSYKVIPANDGGWGNFVDGMWNGAIGMIYRNEADLAVSKFAISKIRLKYVDFSYPYLIEELTFATQMPHFQRQTDAIFRPFTKEIWFVLFITIIIISLTFSILQKISLFKSLHQVFGILMSQSIKIKHGNIKNKVIVNVWIFGSLFLSYCYMTVLSSYLSIPKMEKQPENFKELAAEIIAGNYKAMTFKGSLIAFELQQSKREDIKIIAQHIKKNNYLVEFQKEAFVEIIRKEKFAVICPSTTLKFFLRDEFFVSRDSFKPHLSAIVMPKTFCCKNKIDDFIHILSSSGIYLKLLDDVIFFEGLKSKSSKKFELSENQARSLTLSDMSGAFLLIIVGHTLASLVVFVEYLHFKLYLSSRERQVT